jgi:2-C-methyl-D-erythritol 4-phosphate cytidylyltransferase
MNSAIIVAAGKGTRMGSDKLFLELAGRPVVVHTWQRFDDAKCIDEIILVVGEGRQEEFEKLAAQFHFQKKFQIVVGGAERQDSVWNGLEALSSQTEIVAIHDAARPCVSGELIAATIKSAEENGAAVVAQPVTDTIKESADNKTILRTLDRAKLWSVQTPQTFRVEIIRRAIATARAKKLVFTDDTAACELIGQPVRLVSSVAPNPKVTVPSDLPFIETLLRSS